MPVPTFTASDLQRWHPGELSLQEARGVADEVSDGPTGMSPGLIYGSESFLCQLQLFPLTTLDGEGRPWVSLLSAPGGTPGFIQSLKGEGDDREGLLRLRVKVPPHTPARRHVMDEDAQTTKMAIDPASTEHTDKLPLVASVGVLLHNRRRNKYEGWVEAVTRVQDDGSGGDTFDLDVGITASMGNCPKYINIRALLPSPRASPRLSCPSSLSLSHPPHTPIPDSILSAISHADIIYLGTRHTGSTSQWYLDRTKLGCNIRGGRPGFLRHFWDEARGRHCVVLPDFSGNRFLQSMGNIRGDPVAGVTIPVWHRASEAQDQGGPSGSAVVHLTCDAQVLTGSEASALIRGFQGAVQMWITGYVLIEEALPLLEDDVGVLPGGGDSAGPDLKAAEDHHDDGDGDGQEVIPKIAATHIGFSPYNPPLRAAAKEEGAPALMGGAGGAGQGTWAPEATLVDVRTYELHEDAGGDGDADADADADLNADADADADLNADEADTPTPLATFVWELPASSPACTSLARCYTPGQYVVVDAYDLLDTRLKLYNHMAQFPGGEKDLNDDGTRSWTISGAYAVGGGGGGAGESGSAEKWRTRAWRFETTLRRVERGGVTPGLFNMGKRVAQSVRDGEGVPGWAPRVKLLGIEGGFTLPCAADAPYAAGASTRTRRRRHTLLYLAAGVGLTPVLAHLRALVRRSDEAPEAPEAPERRTRALIVLACRTADVGTMLALLAGALRPAESGGETETETETGHGVGSAQGHSVDVDVDVHLLVQSRPRAGRRSSAEAELARAVRWCGEAAGVDVGGGEDSAPSPSSLSAPAMHVQLHTDKRLTLSSFAAPTTEEEQGEDCGTFHLPLPLPLPLGSAGAHQPERIFICGGARFEAVVRGALGRVHWSEGEGQDKSTGGAVGPDVVSESFGY